MVLSRAATWAGLGLSMATASIAATGQAQAQVLASPLGRLLSEPTDYTDALDAFDDGDAFDFRVSLGFTTSTQVATVLREEAPDAEDGASGSWVLRRFGRYSRTDKRMRIDAQAGLASDLMIHLGIPFVLEDNRSLTPNQAAIDSGLFEADESGSELASRVRIGVPHLELGLAYGPLNQYRIRHVPTWLILLTAQVGIGQAMGPCLADQGCYRGASRGTVGVRAESRLSFRHRYFEPYCGFGYGLEVVTAAASAFSPDGEDGGADALPPTTADALFGVSYIPWEVRQRAQRLAIDMRLQGRYVGRGQDYSPLYDLFGQSAALQAAAEEAGTPFSGLTTVDSHARLRGELGFLVQAARYVRFQVQAALSFSTAHFITGASPCVDGILSQSGCVAGDDNPHYLPDIDRAGQRFRVADMLGLDLSATASAQF